MANLMSGLLDEIDRNKELLKLYEELPDNAGGLAVTFLKLDLLNARKAIEENDVVKMLQVFQALKGNQG